MIRSGCMKGMNKKSGIIRIMKNIWLTTQAFCIISAVFSMNTTAAEPPLDETVIGLEDSIIFNDMTYLDVYVNAQWHGELSGSYSYNDTVSIEAPASIDGKNFSYWKANDMILSFDPSLTFTINANTILYAVYGESVTPSQTVGFISISKDAEDNIIFNTYSTADSADEIGIYYSKTVSSKDALIKSGKREAGNADVNCCTLMISPEDVTAYYYVMPYLKSNGSVAYGNIKKVCSDELETGVSAVIDMESSSGVKLPEEVKPAIVQTAQAPTVDAEGCIHWDPVKNAVKYRVVKEYDNKVYYSRGITDTSYMQEYIPDVEYRIFIRSYDDKGNYTDGDILTVPESDGLGKAKAPTVDDNGAVSWSKVKNASKYVVVKVIDGRKYYGKATTETSFKFANKPRKDYQVYILSYDDNGKYTSGKKVSVKLPLGFVDKVTVDNGKMTWAAAEGAVGYKIGKVVNGRTYYSKKLTDTSYSFKNVPKDDYKVFVVAFDKEGNRTWGVKVDAKVD